MFRNRAAILKESARTKECQSSTLIQVVIALTTFIKILNF